ncbi:MAG: archease [Deltaproteobacteria bacterium]|nr:MAG: archease [Deltaproteobacteria bacterium]
MSAFMKTHETFDHTADIGIRAFGRTVEEVFVHAAEALFEVLTDLDSIRGHLTREVEINGSDREDLFVRWLGELLYLCEGEGYLFREFSIFQLTPTCLKAAARGERFDPSRHEFKTEIKAVTYHQVEVSQKDGVWVGKVIFDI